MNDSGKPTNIDQSTIRPEQSNEDIPTGRPVTPDEESWLSYGIELVKKSPDVLNEVSKYYITINTSLITIYATALTLFKISGKFSINLSIITALPVIFWISSILLNSSVYFPTKTKFVLNDAENIMKSIITRSNRKYELLKLATFLFVIGIALAFYVIISGTGAQEPQYVKLIIKSDGGYLFNNYTTYLNNDTLETEPLYLVDVKENTYVIKAPNTTKLEFNKNIVLGIVYLNS